MSKFKTPVASSLLVFVGVATAYVGATPQLLGSAAGRIYGGTGAGCETVQKVTCSTSDEGNDSACKNLTIPGCDMNSPTPNTLSCKKNNQQQNNCTGKSGQCSGDIYSCQ